MQEMTRVFLENELDVILAHKRSMRLAELAGLTISGQTTFATAVSEVSRNAVEQSSNGQLILGIAEGSRSAEKFIVALVREDAPEESERRTEGYQYAKKLVDTISHTRNDAESNIELRFRIPNAHRITAADFQRWSDNFENDLPSSPYDEIKRKNRQLVALTEKLRNSELQYRTLTESLPMLIFTWHGGELKFANKWASEYTGKSLQELNATDWSDIIHQDDYRPSIDRWEKCATLGEPMQHSQVRLRHRDGDYLWHIATMIPQKNEHDQIVYWIGTCVNIHAQKLVEETLKENKELQAARMELEVQQEELRLRIQQLNKSNEELERFAYVASHDLQEPLRKIIFYSDYLLKHYQHAYDEQGQLFFNNLIKASSRMQQMINDVLAYSTIRQEPVQHTLVHVQEVIESITQDLDLLISDNQARLTVGALPVIYGNRAQLYQLFSNLIGNSIKYKKPDVAPVITISSITDSQGMAHISVADNGIGFEDEYLEKMFNLFQRLHTREHYDGTGIGLAISKRVAELHGGSITANGKVGEGATFTVRLPASFE